MAFLELLPRQRLEQRIGELKPALNPDQARAEALRCLYCYDAPCIAACPTGINIPEFIRKLGTGNLWGSARSILDANILGYSCARVCPVEVLCEGACVYNDKDHKPIAIGKLQQYATDAAYQKGWRYFQRGKPTGKRVALVGGGPASLACAHELSRYGHECVIFEKRALPGGLNTTGVAPYKMQAEEALRELEYVLAIGGVELRTGVEVGREVAWADLEREYDAVFLGVGLGEDSRLGVTGQDLPGVEGACELIERIKNQPGGTLDGVRRLVTVGGGNTAIDVVREARHLGVPEVTLVYRRGEVEKPCYAHEYEWAKREGVAFRWLSQPVAVLGNGRVEGLRLVRMDLGEPDESGRRRPRPVAGSEHEIPADRVVFATGQETLEAFFRSIPGLAFAKGGLAVEPETGRTGHPKVFAGGDCVNGGKEVVNAAAEGKLAARGIQRMLGQGSQRTKAR